MGAPKMSLARDLRAGRPRSEPAPSPTAIPAKAGIRRIAARPQPSASRERDMSARPNPYSALRVRPGQQPPSPRAIPAVKFGRPLWTLKRQADAARATSP